MNTTSRTLLTATCLLSLAVFPACLDIETTSQVNADGSILRTITFEDDSAAIHRGIFPIPMDSGWQKSVRKIDKDKWKLTASRLFHDVDQMNRALKGTFGKTLQSGFTLDRSFQWFFTTYRFTETSLKYIQYDSIPLTDFVSPSEIEAWKRHEIEKVPYATKGDSLAIVSAGKRGEEWDARNVFEPVFATFLDGVRELNNPKLTPSVVAAQKDTLYEVSVKSLELGNIDTLRLIFSKTLKNSLVSQAWRLRTGVFREIKAKRELNFVSGVMVSNVIMPGLITGSNAQSIEGNKATWRDYKDYARMLGYTMWVESRQVNWWAVILTGAIVVVLGALLTVSALKRRRLV